MRRAYKDSFIHPEMRPHGPITTIPPLRAADAHRVTLSAKHRQVRIKTALHEAAHFVAGVIVQAEISGAYIRVPGQRTSIPKDVMGRCYVEGCTSLREAVIYAAGVVVEPFINSEPKHWARQSVHDTVGLLGVLQRAYPDIQRNACDDLADLNKYQTVRLCPDLHRLVDIALLIVVRYWQAIDGVAAGFLALGDKRGHVSARDCIRLRDWVRSGQWYGRHTYLYIDDRPAVAYYSFLRGELDEHDYIPSASANVALRRAVEASKRRDGDPLALPQVSVCWDDPDGLDRIDDECLGELAARAITKLQWRGESLPS